MLPIVPPRRARPVVVVLALVAVTDCAHVLPPPPQPEMIVPRTRKQPAGPPSDGHGRVLFDVVQGPTALEMVTSTETVVGANGVVTEVPVVEHICVTPCYVDAALGSHRMIFRPADSRADDAIDVMFGATPTVYRRHVAFGQFEPIKGYGGAALFALGILGIVGGASLYAIEELDSEYEHGEEPVAHTKRPLILGITGAGLTAIGGVIMHLSRPTKREGRAVQWPQPPGDTVR